MCKIVAIMQNCGRHGLCWLCHNVSTGGNYLVLCLFFFNCFQYLSGLLSGAYTRHAVLIYFFTFEIVCLLCSGSCFPFFHTVFPDGLQKKFSRSLSYAGCTQGVGSGVPNGGHGGCEVDRERCTCTDFYRCHSHTQQQKAGTRSCLPCPRLWRHGGRNFVLQ